MINGLMIRQLMTRSSLKIDAILKWVATITLIIGTFINAGYPEFYPIGPAILALGGAIWLIVSFMWKEPALIITNGVLTIVGIAGIILATS